VTKLVCFDLTSSLQSCNIWAPQVGRIDTREANMWRQTPTLTAYLVGISVVFAILNGIAWWWDAPRAHGLAVFAAGFVLGALGMYLAAYLYGYRRGN